MTRAPALALLVAPLVVAAPARAQPALPTEITREQLSASDFAEAKAVGLSMTAELGPTRGGPRGERFDDAPAPVDLTPQAVDALTARLGRSFFLGTRMDHRLTIEGDLSFFPALADGSLAVEWTRVVGPGGKNVLGKPAAEPAGRGRRAGPPPPRWTADGLRSEHELRLTTGDDKAALARAEGTAVFKVATAFTRLELPCKTGAKGTTDGRTVTLRRCEGDYVELDWPGTDRPAVILGDGKGRRFATPSEVALPLFSGQRTLFQLEYSDLPQKIEGVRIALNAAGRIATVLIAAPRAFAERKVAVVATPEPVVDGGKPVKVAAPRTLWEAPGATSVPGPVATSAAEVRAGTRAVAGRSYAVMGYNTPTVEVRLPRVLNSLFATIEFGESTLLDRQGQPVEHGQETAWVQWPQLSNEVRFSPASGDGPVQLARARGTAKIRYPVAMRIVTLTPAAPTAGDVTATFAGARVTLTGEPGDAPDKPTGAPASFDVVRAYSRDGERLRPLSDPAPTGEGRTLAFWGEPASIRLTVVDRWEELELPYDLPPAPLLPAGKEGLRPE